MSLNHSNSIIDNFSCFRTNNFNKIKNEIKKSIYLDIGNWPVPILHATLYCGCGYTWKKIAIEIMRRNAVMTNLLYCIQCPVCLCSCNSWKQFKLTLLKHWGRNRPGLGDRKIKGKSPQAFLALKQSFLMSLLLLGNGETTASLSAHAQNKDYSEKLNREK